MSTPPEGPLTLVLAPTVAPTTAHVALDRDHVPPVTAGPDGELLAHVHGNVIPVPADVPDERLRVDVLAYLAVLEHRRRTAGPVDAPPHGTGAPMLGWAPTVLPRALREDASPAEVRAAAAHYYGAAVATSADVEDALAPALGFEPYPPGSPGFSPDRVNYAVGDHVAESLALLAARRLLAVREVLEAGKHDDVCAMGKEASAGERCSCWKAAVTRALGATL